jgi:hypothetical protein
MTRLERCTLIRAMGVYPNSSHSEAQRIPLISIIPVLSFHELTNCPFSIFFLLTFMHRMGSVGSAFQFSLQTSSFQTLTSVFSSSSALFCAFLHFFALTQKSTLFFSSDSELFGKNTGSGVGSQLLWRALRFAEYGHESLVASIGFPPNHSIESPRRIIKRACTQRNEAIA